MAELALRDRKSKTMGRGVATSSCPEESDRFRSGPFRGDRSTVLAVTCGALTVLTLIRPH